MPEDSRIDLPTLRRIEVRMLLAIADKYTATRWSIDPVLMPDLYHEAVRLECAAHQRAADAARVAENA